MGLEIASFETADELGDFVNGAKAVGRLTMPDPMHLTDGQTITIDDGTNPASVFEIDYGGGVGGGNVQVDVSAIADGDKDALATALETAINGVAGTLTVTATAAGDKVALEADTADATHNVDITQVATSIAFGLEGMAGGSVSVPQANIISIDHVRGRWYLSYWV